MKNKKCKVKGCKSKVAYYGMCSLHGNRFRRYGDPHFIVRPQNRGLEHCTAEGCKRPHYAKEMCRLHYKRAAAGIEQLPCKVCGEDTPKAGAKFCSPKCSRKWHRQFGCYTPEQTALNRGTCSFEGCNKPVKAHGLCGPHDMKLWRYGDPTHPHAIREASCTRCGVACKVRKTGDPYCKSCYFNMYYYRNHAVEKSRRSARRQYFKQATPKWADLKMIERFYAACPEGFEVDHAVPLKGKRVSGLHTIENLQYLPWRENRTKLNSHFH